MLNRTIKDIDNFRALV